MEPDVELSEHAQSLMQEERWSEAIALIESQTSHETDGELSWNLGWAYFKLENYDSAELHLARATQLTPTSASTWWALGTAQHEHGLLDNAERNLKHSLTLKDSSNSRMILAVVLWNAANSPRRNKVHLTGSAMLE